MKIKRAIFALGALLALAGIAPQSAHAQASYCGGGAISVSGDLAINQTSGDCTINGNVTASGSITITAPGSVTVNGATFAGTSVTIEANGGNVTAQNVTANGGRAKLTASGDVSTNSIIAGTFVEVDATSGDITTQNITANNGSIKVIAAKELTTQNILATEWIDLRADDGAIKAEDVTATASNKAVSLRATKEIETSHIQSNDGDIAFYANYQKGHGESSDQLNLGGASATWISSQGGRIIVTNGGNGGINISSGSALNSYKSSGSGDIAVDACNKNDTTSCQSTLTLPSGTISTDSSGPAGVQVYIAKTIIANGTTLSASDSVTSAGSPVRFIVLSTQTLTLSGNLSIYANGARPLPTPTSGGSIQINPLGANSVTGGFTPFSGWGVPTTLTAASGLTIGGTGALNLNALGLNAEIFLQGKPFTHSAGALTIFTNDSNAKTVFSSPSGSSMSFTGSSLIGVYASGSSGNGDAGKILFYPGVVGTITPAIQLYANGTGTGKGGTVEINAASGNLKIGTQNGSILPTATGGSAGGGTVKILTPGNITFDNSGQAPNLWSTSNGDGGNLEMDAAVIASLRSAGTPIFANGENNGKGGTIKITAGTIPGLASGANPLYLMAYGGINGAGGKVEIHQANITYDTGGIDVHAGKGDGGTIEFADNFDVAINGTMSANAGSSGDGAGGIINIHDAGFINVGSSTLEAYGNGNGKGGDITLDATLPVNLVLVEVNAKAGAAGNGAGGTFTATHAKGNPGITLRVNTIIKVDPGSNANVTTGAGSIALNGVTCGQWKTGTGTGSTSWPKTYWNCAHAVPETYESLVPDAVLGLPSSFRTTLGTHDVPIYIFNLNSDYNSFFSPTAPVSAVLGISEFVVPYAAVFEYNGGLNVTAYLRGNMMHELGHLVDNFTVPLHSSQTGFVNATNSMIAATTAATCAQVYGTAPEGLAICAAYPTRNPWDIFTDYLGAQDTYQEMFANYFQVCSGHPTNVEGKQTAMKSPYMISLRNYFNSTVWPGGCAP